MSQSNLACFSLTKDQIKTERPTNKQQLYCNDCRKKKKLGICGCLWILDFRQSLNVKDLNQSTKIMLRFRMLICPVPFEAVKLRGPCKKCQQFLNGSCNIFGRPLKAESLHVNHILIASFQIHRGGIHITNDKNSHCLNTFAPDCSSQTRRLRSKNDLFF